VDIGPADSSITKADATPQLTLEIVKSFNKEQPLRN